MPALQDTDVSSRALEAVRRAADEVAPLLGEEARRWALVERELVPEYKQYGDLEEVSRASLEAQFRLLTTVIADRLDPTDVASPAEGVLAAREYAQVGLPLTALLRSFRVAHANIWRFWFERLRQIVDDAEVLAEAVAYVSETMFAFVDAVATQMGEAYATEREQWYRSDAAARLEAIRELLGERSRGVAELERVLGYPLEREHVALLLWSNPGDVLADTGRVQRTAQRLVAALSSGAGLVVPLGRFAVAAWAPTGRMDAPAALAPVDRDDGVMVAVGEPGRGVEGFRATYEEAEHARRVSGLLGRGAGALTAYRDIAFVALATADPAHATRFARRELGRLAAADDTSLRLRSTLAVYFEAGGSVAETARRIGVHQNTVANRLQRAAVLRGRALDERQLELRVALTLFSLVGPASPPE